MMVPQLFEDFPDLANNAMHTDSAMTLGLISAAIGAEPVIAMRYAQTLAQVGKAWWATGTFLVLWLMIADVKAQDFTYTNINGAIRITGLADPGGYVGALSI